MIFFVKHKKHSCTLQVHRKIPISPGAYICSKGLFVIFFETLYGILGEGVYFRGGGGLLSEFYGMLYKMTLLYTGFHS